MYFRRSASKESRRHNGTSGKEAERIRHSPKKDSQKKKEREENASQKISSSRSGERFRKERSESDRRKGHKDELRSRKKEADVEREKHSKAEKDRSTNTKDARKDLFKKEEMKNVGKQQDKVSKVTRKEQHDPDNGKDKLRKEKPKKISISIRTTFDDATTSTRAPKRKIGQDREHFSSPPPPKRLVSVKLFGSHGTMIIYLYING